jgi:histidine triad (HIT) family protein
MPNPQQPANPTVEALRQASKGLLMPSESDAPFKPFLWDAGGGDLTHEKLLQLAHEPTGAPVEEATLDDLFATVPSAGLPRFQALRKALEQQLSGVKVYKVGDEAERQVHIVGKTRDGKLAGLKTSVVET